MDTRRATAQEMGNDKTQKEITSRTQKHHGDGGVQVGAGEEGTRGDGQCIDVGRV